MVHVERAKRAKLYVFLINYVNFSAVCVFLVQLDFRRHWVSSYAYILNHHFYFLVRMLEFKSCL